MPEQPFCQAGSRLQGIITVTNIVMLFIMLLQALENLDRLINGRFHDINFLKAARQRPIFLLTNKLSLLATGC